MPYSHFHNWSIHTHHRRPKFGRHYRAVQHRQRPWKIGLVLLLLGLAGFAIFELFLKDRLETGVLLGRGQGVVVGSQEDAGPEGPAVNLQTMSERTQPDPEAVEQRRQEQKAQAEREQVRHEKEILSLINAERMQRGAAPLNWDPGLHAVAVAHSRDMATQGYLEHVNPRGHGSGDRLRAAGYVCVGTEGGGTAENINFTNRNRHPQNAFRNWLGSPGHRDAMLDPAYSKAAVGARDGNLPGMGHGEFSTLLLC